MKINLEINESQVKIINSAMSMYMKGLKDYSDHWSKEKDYRKCADADLARLQVYDLIGQIFDQLDETMRP